MLCYITLCYVCTRARPRADLRVRMTRNFYAVGMCNAILRNYMTEVYNVFIILQVTKMFKIVRRHLQDGPIQITV